jgi:hypothetical protein
MNLGDKLNGTVHMQVAGYKENDKLKINVNAVAVSIDTVQEACMISNVNGWR